MVYIWKSSRYSGQKLIYRLKIIEQEMRSRLWEWKLQRQQHKNENNNCQNLGEAAVLSQWKPVFHSEESIDNTWADHQTGDLSMPFRVRDLADHPKSHVQKWLKRVPSGTWMEKEREWVIFAFDYMPSSTVHIRKNILKCFKGIKWSVGLWIHQWTENWMRKHVDSEKQILRQSGHKGMQHLSSICHQAPGWWPCQGSRWIVSECPFLMSISYPQMKAKLTVGTRCCFDGRVCARQGDYKPTEVFELWIRMAQLFSYSVIQT